jgi:hypothetical protein
MTASPSDGAADARERAAWSAEAAAQGSPEHIEGAMVETFFKTIESRFVWQAVFYTPA